MGPDLALASGPPAVAPPAPDVCPAPPSVVPPARAIAPPRPVRSRSLHRPAGHRRSPPQSPRPRAPVRRGDGPGRSVPARRPGLARSPRCSPRPWPQPSRRSAATATANRAGAPPRAPGWPTHASDQRRHTAKRGGAAVPQAARAGACRRHQRRVPPPTQPSPTASLTAPTTPSAPCSAAAAAPLGWAQRAPAPQPSRGAHPRRGWRPSGARPGTSPRLHGCTPSRPGRAQAQTGAGCRVEGAVPSGHHGTRAARCAGRSGGAGCGAGR